MLPAAVLCDPHGKGLWSQRLDGDHSWQIYSGHLGIMAVGDGGSAAHSHGTDFLRLAKSMRLVPREVASAAR